MSIEIFEIDFSLENLSATEKVEKILDFQNLAKRLLDVADGILEVMIDKKELTLGQAFTIKGKDVKVIDNYAGKNVAYRPAKVRKWDLK